MRGKTYYTAKGLTKAALAVHAIPILWAIISNYMIENRVDDRALQNYGIILLIGKALIPIAVIMGAGITIVAWYIWFFHNLPAM